MYNKMWCVYEIFFSHKAKWNCHLQGNGWKWRISLGEVKQVSRRETNITHFLQLLHRFIWSCVYRLNVVQGSRTTKGLVGDRTTHEVHYIRDKSRTQVSHSQALQPFFCPAWFQLCLPIRPWDPFRRQPRSPVCHQWVSFRWNLFSLSAGSLVLARDSVQARSRVDRFSETRILSMIKRIYEK